MVENGEGEGSPRTPLVRIVDYGMGNVGSILNMLQRLGHRAEVCKSLRDIREADALVLPGVGAFDTAMQKLRTTGMAEVLTEAVMGRQVPVLGICLGMQLLGKSSEEGDEAGLGWIDASTIRFSFGDESRLRLPHMGWNEVLVPKPSMLFNDASEVHRFYFVHSYYVRCAKSETIAATACYGHEFCAAVAQANVFGTQFHPEKSHSFGLRLLDRFVRGGAVA